METVGHTEKRAWDEADSQGTGSVRSTEITAPPTGTTPAGEATESKTLSPLPWRSRPISALPLLAVLTLLVFAFEAAIMGLLALMTPMAVVPEAIFDTSLLTVFLFPALYFLSFRPLVSELERRGLMERALEAANQALKHRVGEHTAALQEASVQLGAEIEERRRSETVAAESVRLYRSLFDNQLAGVYVADLEGRLLDCNDAFVSIHGYASRDDLLEQSAGTPFGDPPSWAPPLSTLPIDGRPVLVERSSSRRDGQPVWLLESVTVVPETEGRPARIEGAQLDISDRKRAESEREILLRKLEHEKERIRTLAEEIERDRDLLRVVMSNTKAHLAFLDPDFNFVLANAAYAEAGGHSVEELIGRNHFELFPEVGSRALFEQVRETGLPIELRAEPHQFRGDTQNGSTYWDWTLAPVTDRGGEFQGLVLSMMDVTEVTRAQQTLRTAHGELEDHVRERTADLARANQALEAELQERRRAEEMVRRREQTFRSLAENLPDVVSRFDGELRVTYVSRDVTAAIGLDRGALLGKTIGEMPLPPAVAAQWDTELRYVLDTGEVGTIEFSFDTPAGTRWYEARMLPEHGPGGRVETVLAVSRDISQRRQAELALRRYGEEQKALYTVAAAASNLQEVDHLLDVLLEAVITVTKADAGWVTVTVDPAEGRPRVAAFRGVSEAFVDAEAGEPLDRCLLCSVLKTSGQRTTGPHPLGDCTRIPRDLIEASGLKSHSALTLNRGDRLFGYLNVAWHEPQTYSEADQALLEALGHQMSVALSNAALFQSEKRARRTADTLRSASMALTGQLEPATVLSTLLDALSTIVDCDRGSVMLLDEAGRLVLRAAKRPGKGVELFTDPPPSFEPSRNPVVEALISTGRAVRIPDIRTHPEWSSPAATEWVRSWMGVPLVAGDRTIGIYTLGRTELNPFSDDQLRLAEGLAAPAAMALANASLFHEVRHGRERLQTLSRELVEIQEKERRSIARELHDEAGQTLTSLMVGLRLLDRDLDKPDRARLYLEQATDAAENVLEGLHRLAADLRPASLDHLGLVAALEQLVSELSTSGGPGIEFEAVGVTEGDRLPTALETAIFRVAQAALTNAVLHAHATRIGTLLQSHGDRLVLVVEDNGVGFDPAVAESSGRLGLAGMRERVEMLGGILTIETRKNAGTTILMEVPCDLSSAACR